jgi:hypothetical protein
MLGADISLRLFGHRILTDYHFLSEPISRSRLSGYPSVNPTELGVLSMAII